MSGQVSSSDSRANETDNPARAAMTKPLSQALTSGR